MSAQQENWTPRNGGRASDEGAADVPQGLTPAGAAAQPSVGGADPAVVAPAALSADERAAHAILGELRAQLSEAYAAGRPIRLQGGDTHRFYGNPWPAGRPDPEVIDCRRYSGVVHYDPSELVVTVRAGTPLAELEALLSREGQCLPFEPPHFEPGGTVGGMVATGLSGPRRLSTGAVRDFILGTVLVSPGGEVMRFGGEVMKNVAGYDVSRLLVGSMGVLGMIAEVSLKVLPQPKADQTLALPMTEAEAIKACNQWGGKPLPVGATLWHDGVLWVRLCGAERAVESAQQQLGGEVIGSDEAAGFWLSIRNQRHPYFWQPGPLWRLSVPSTAEALSLPGPMMTEWGGALRWYVPPAGEVPSAMVVREVAERAGGTATLFRADEAHADVPRFHPLAPVNQAIQRRLKQAFDPAGLINPARLYDWL